MEDCTAYLSGKVADIINDRLVSLPDGSPDHPLFVYNDVNGKTSIVDCSIYEKSRCFRMLYNVKKKPPSVPLLPYLGSSAFLVDHLVRVHASNCPPAGMTLLPSLDPGIVEAAGPPPPPKMEAPPCIGAARRAKSRPDGADAVIRASWQPGDIVHIRTSLLYSEHVARIIKVERGELRFNSETTRWVFMTYQGMLREGRGGRERQGVPSEVWGVYLNLL